MPKMAKVKKECQKPGWEQSTNGHFINTILSRKKWRKQNESLIMWIINDIVNNPRFPRVKVELSFPPLRDWESELSRNEELELSRKQETTTEISF